jgi:calcium-dependent protein kinase
MQTVDHPNIVRYFETYDDFKSLYLCTELCTGGELFTKIERENRITEAKAALYMQKLVSALQHCHA